MSVLLGSLLSRACDTPLRVQTTRSMNPLASNYAVRQSGYCTPIFSGLGQCSSFPNYHTTIILYLPFSGLAKRFNLADVSFVRQITSCKFLRLLLSFSKSFAPIYNSCGCGRVVVASSSSKVNMQLCRTGRAPQNLAKIPTSIRFPSTVAT